jgi:hypothetical protein
VRGRTVDNGLLDGRRGQFGGKFVSGLLLGGRFFGGRLLAGILARIFAGILGSGFFGG